MVAVHGLAHLTLNDHLNGMCDIVEVRVELLEFLVRKLLKDPGLGRDRGVLAHTQPDTVIVYGVVSYGSIHGFNTIMAPGASTGLEPEAKRRKVDFVMDDNEVLRSDLVKLEDRPHALTAEIHEGLGLDQSDLLASEGGFKNLTLVPKNGAGRLPAVDESVDGEEAGIVPRGFIFGSGIAEADDKFHESLDKETANAVVVMNAMNRLSKRIGNTELRDLGVLKSHSIKRDRVGHDDLLKTGRGDALKCGS